MELSLRETQIIDILIANPSLGISDIQKHLDSEVPIPTLNRDLRSLVEGGVLIRKGIGRAIVYEVAIGYKLINSGIGDSYFNKDVDERKGKRSFEPDVFSYFQKIEIFSKEELSHLDGLQRVFSDRVKTLPDDIKRKERNRLTIELSWKSSQIEGNTYSLLETEVLLSELIRAEGKTEDEATMLLNHKKAMDCIYDQQLYLNPLRVSSIEDIHSVLIEGLGVSRNIRKRIVGITGTSYTPPDNEHQIREYLQAACELINQRALVFEKAMLSVLFISYIQPFEDGNKRTGRITGNGILIDNGYCPLSYRSIKPLDYKKAMILFYEQNNVALYKKLFMEQFEFAVNNYFR